MKFFLTNSPAFYKISLFNEINKREKIFVFFLSSNGKTRNSDFFDEKIEFDYKVLSESFVKKIFALWKNLISDDYSELIIDGWDRKEYWFAAFFSKRQKNSVIVESGIFESKATGIKAFFKRVFLSRIKTAYPSGINHKELLEALKFKGEIKIQGGVGLIRLQPQPEFKERHVVRNFLYVGRLIDVKNLELLIKVFNELPLLRLNIIGFGELENELKSIANKNVQFLGAVKNKDLPKYYQSNDVFILPSKSEPWGLVVEEAMNNGMPVILGDMVGCKDDLVSDETGLIFEHSNKDSLETAIKKICDVDFYNSLRLGVSKMDFAARMKNQVDVFI